MYTYRVNKPLMQVMINVQVSNSKGHSLLHDVKINMINTKCKCIITVDRSVVVATTNHAVHVYLWNLLDQYVSHVQHATAVSTA